MGFFFFRVTMWEIRPWSCSNCKKGWLKFHVRNPTDHLRVRLFFLQAISGYWRQSHVKSQPISLILKLATCNETCLNGDAARLNVWRIVLTLWLAPELAVLNLNVFDIPVSSFSIPSLWFCFSWLCGALSTQRMQHPKVRLACYVPKWLKSKRFS